MNVMLQNVSPWLSDYFLLATVLLVSALVAGRFVGQPARRIAIAWSAAMALFGLGLLCAVPGWSLVHLLHDAAPNHQELPKSRVTPPAMLSIPTIDLEQKFSPPPLPKPSLASVSPPKTKPISWTAWLIGTYLGGCLFALLWQASGGVLAHRLIRRATPAPVEHQTLLVEMGEDAKQLPRLLVSDRIQTPAALGVFAPVILLPPKMLPSEYDTLRPILAHELAHIRHRDLWLLALLRGLLLVLWAHPLYWLWRRRVRLDQETLADVAAAEVTSRTNYAEQLVAMARETVSVSRRLPLASSVGLWENASQLKQRVAVLLDEKLTVLRSCTRRWRVGAAMGMLAIAGGLSLITLNPAEPQTASAESQEVITKEGPGFVVRHITPPSDANEESSSTAVLKPTTSTKNTTNEAQLRLRKQHYKRLNKIRKPNTIIGICIDEKGQPLADVPIEVYLRQLYRPGSNPTPLLETKSDAKGEFFFENVVDVAKEFPEGLPEEYQIAVPQEPDAKILYIQGRVEGRVPGVSSNTSVNLVRYGSTFVWVMSPAKELRGRVTDNAGLPVADAKVTVGFYASQGGSHGIRRAADRNLPATRPSAISFQRSAFSQKSLINDRHARSPRRLAYGELKADC